MSFEREQIGDCTLYRGDAREILPNLGQIEAIVTDPPYGIGFVQRTTGLGIHGDTELFNPSPFLQVAQECLFFGAEHFAHALPRGGRWLVWMKRAIEIAAPKSYGDCELAWVSSPGCIKAIRHISDGCIRQGVEHGIVRLHPSQKPIAVMAWCLSFIKAQTICDPYMGSGSTGIACMIRNRSFLGIEVEPRYFDIACRRIEEAYTQGDLFRPPLRSVPVHQEVLFA